MNQDTPTYEASRIHQPARMREVLRIAATLGKPQVAREIILEWLEHDSSTQLPESAWKGQAFRHEVNDRSFTAVRDKGETADTWALRSVGPDETVTERVWTTEVTVQEQPGHEALFSVRSLAKSPELKLRSQPTVPGFMEHVASECGLEQGAAKVEKDPWIIESDYDAANLTEFLVDPDRRTPAFVLTVSEESDDPHRPLLDPQALAVDTLGIAKVVVLPAEFTWKLTNRFGKRLSVYRGAMRVYLPGFREDTEQETGHDLFMPHRMDTPETAGRLGALLRWMAARESLRRMRLGKDVLAFASVLSPSIASETEQLAASGASDAERLAAAQEHLGVLREELKIALEMQQWLTEENKSLESRVRESESRFRGAQNRGRMMPDRGRMDRPRPRYSPYDSDRDERPQGGYGRYSRGYDREPRGYDRESRFDRDREPRGYDRESRGYDRESRYDRDREPRGDRDREPRGDRGDYERQSQGYDRQSDADDRQSGGYDWQSGGGWNRRQR